MKDSSKFVAALLRQHRESSGLSVPQVVSLLKSRYRIIVSEKTLYGYENGVSMPKVTTFIALCTIYNVGNLSTEFGYATTVSITNDENTWTADQYDEFFNSSILEKVYLLIRWGIPDFSGYYDKLTDFLPGDADAANFERLYETFKKLSNEQHDSAFFALEQLAVNQLPAISRQDLDFLRMFRPYLTLLNDDGLDELLHQAENLVGNSKFTSSSFDVSSQVG